MNIIRVSIANLLTRKLNSLLIIILVALSTGLISMFFNISKQAEQQFSKNLDGIDMVIGAKGSPLQLVLSVVYHLDNPTGNISLHEAEKVRENPLIGKGIPVSLGDNYQGYRIVGTDTQYPEHFQASLMAGRLWEAPFEVAIGRQVADLTGLSIGDSFVSSHGITGGGHTHDDKPFEVVGIFDPNHSVMDQLILTSLESVWKIHEHVHHDDHTDHEENHDHDKRQITAMFIQFINPLGIVQLPRIVNETTQMQAAIPRFEIEKLLGFFGFGANLFIILGFIILFVAGLSLFTGLFGSLLNRKPELAFMRLYGASRGSLVAMVFFEGLTLALLGYLSGLLVSRLGLVLVANAMSQSLSFEFIPQKIVTQDLLMLPLTIAIALIASLIPAVIAFRINIPNSLSDG